MKQNRWKTLERLDFFKRDHHLSSAGALKPDELKQWQILCSVCSHILPALKYFYSFFSSRVPQDPREQQEVQVQAPLLRPRANGLFVCLTDATASLLLSSSFPLLRQQMWSRRRSSTSGESCDCKRVRFHRGSASRVYEANREGARANV